MDNPSDDGQAAITSTPGTPPEVVGKALPTGAQIAEFEIIRVLGEGGFGIVYLAFDQLLHRHVAIKEYFPSSYAVRRDAQTITALSPNHEETYRAGMASFIEEARLLARFEHPALVKVLRYWESNGTAYMVMPHYQGRTLKDLLKGGEAFSTEAELRALMLPLLEAVAVMHDEQCFHRDISPENVIIRPSGAPVLLDFGAARRILSDSTKALTVVLKQNYAPIEQYSDDGAMPQGPWTDIYALSAVMYTAIVRKPPPSAVARVYQDPVKPLAKAVLPGFTPQFLGGVDIGMAVRPEDRPRTIAAFREALGLDGGAAPGVPPVARAPAKEPPAAAAVAAAVPVKPAPPPAATARPAPVKPAPPPAEPAPVATSEPAAATTLDKARVVVTPDSRYVPPGSGKPASSRTFTMAALALAVVVAAGGGWYALTQRGADSTKVAMAPAKAPAPAPAEAAKEPPKILEPAPAAAPAGPSAAAEAAPPSAAVAPEPAAEPPSAAMAPAPAAPAPAPAAPPSAIAPPAKASAASPPAIAPPAVPPPAKASAVSPLPKEKEKEKAPPKAPAADKAAVPEKTAPPAVAAATKPAAPAFQATAPSAPAAEPPRPVVPAEDDAPRDLSDEARKLFAAANRGDANAQVALARLYAQGKGAPQSDTEAARWMRKAADQGNTEAWHALGVLYEGGRGVAKDPAEAAKWYRRAGERGNPVSQNNLGAMYASGIGVGKDDTEAVAWYRKAADQGNARGQYNLAMMYLAGHGVAKDEAEAARLLRRAADQGLAPAQFQLGTVYASGRGVMKDEAEAVVWYRKAAAQGNAQAAERLKQLEGK